jgi:hypothetical protein
LFRHVQAWTTQPTIAFPLDATRDRLREYSTFRANEGCKNASAEPLSTRIRPRQTAQTTRRKKRKRVRFEHFNEHLHVRGYPLCLLWVPYRGKHEPKVISSDHDGPRDTAREPDDRSDASPDIPTTRGRDQKASGKPRYLSIPLTCSSQPCIVNRPQVAPRLFLQRPEMRAQ